jgi:hypothetical protein
VTGERNDPVPAGGASSGQLLVIACDESGYEGEKLIGTTTDVFAHGGVHLDLESAANCIRELRGRIRSPATEYKANHLLRQKHRPVLEWLLGPLGPLQGNAHVYLVDKAFFVVGKVVDLLVGEVGQAAGTGPHHGHRAEVMAGTLYREGRHAFGREQWEALLVSANNLMRAKDRPGVRTSVDSFFRMVDVLRLAGTRGRVDEILGLLGPARPRADSFRAQLLDDPKMIPALDPLIPAIVRAVLYWGAGGKPVSIVHDRQNALSKERVAQLKEMVNTPRPAPPGGSPGVRLDGVGSDGVGSDGVGSDGVRLDGVRLDSLSLVDSGLDARIQVADIVAGTARKIASDELNHRGDAQLTALLRPYVDSFSIWGDERSWSLLGPTSIAQSDSGSRRALG